MFGVGNWVQNVLQQKIVEDFVLLEYPMIGAMNPNDASIIFFDPDHTSFKKLPLYCCGLGKAYRGLSSLSAQPLHGGKGQNTST